jgi:hypothetical protein
MAQFHTVVLGVKDLSAVEYYNKKIELMKEKDLLIVLLLTDEAD